MIICWSQKAFQFMHMYINTNITITCTAGKTSYKQQRDQAHLC